MMGHVVCCCGDGVIVVMRALDGETIAETQLQYEYEPLGVIFEQRKLVVICAIVGKGGSGREVVILKLQAH